jgi:CheY-like chemotaxis protein
VNPLDVNKPSSGQHQVVQVLIAEDVETLAKLTEMFLEGLGLQFFTAKDGQAALRRVRELRPALVIADVQMPGKDGFELCADIKADPELRQTPVVLCSVAGADEAMQRRARLSGAHVLLSKPVSADALRRVVKELLGQRVG